MGKKAWLTSLALAVAALAALAPAAGAETLTVTQNTDVAIPTNGNGNPYPSELTVSGADGDITDVNVQLTLTHTFPDDLDIVLVAPSGDSEVLMSDACGEGDLTSASLNFDSDAGAPLSNTGPCGPGTSQPTNFSDSPADNWPPPGPGAPSTTQLGNYDGEVPNGAWKLFIVDDVAGDSGTLLSWSVTITTNTAEVIIPGTGTSGTAKPYPSTKTFNTLPGQVVSDVNFQTPSFSHTWPDDVDMLLAGPRAGATAMLLSDACGSLDVTHFIWTIDDEAPAKFADNGNCIPILNQPSDYEPGDKLPAPAPPGPYGSTLSVFDGLEGGAWRLFIQDDVDSDSGYMQGWTLQITTRNAADTGFAASSVRVEEGGKALLEVKRTGQANLGPATLNVTTGGAATAGADFTAPPATLEFALGQASKTIEIPIADDKVGEATERFNVVLSSPRDDARLTGTTSTEVTIGPDNEFKFGKLKRNVKKGTARLFLNLPGPGKLTTRSKQIKRIDLNVKKGGNLALLLKPKGKAVNKLEDAGSAKVALKVTFTPVDGSALTATRKAKLILND